MPQGGTSLRMYRPRKNREEVDYLRVTDAPAASSCSLAFSASSLETPSSRVLGAPSTRSFASFRPREVRARTSLITAIFLSPADSRTTSNSDFSSAASPAAPPATTATGAAAVTSNSSSNALTNSETSTRDSSLNAAMSSSTDVRGVNLQYLPEGRSNLGCVTRYSRSRC